MTFDGPSRRVVCDPVDLRTKAAPTVETKQPEPRPAAVGSASSRD